MRSNIEGCRIGDFYIEKGLRLASMELTVADNTAIDEDSPPWIIMDAAGAVDLLLPESTPARKGLTFFLTNISASTITVKSSGDAAFTTAISLATMESTIVICTGHATAALGWRGFATAAST